MKILGIDYGDVRVGLAVSDVTEFLASGIGNVKIKGMNDALQQMIKFGIDLHKHTFRIFFISLGGRRADYSTQKKTATTSISYFPHVQTPPTVPRLFSVSPTKTQLRECAVKQKDLKPRALSF